VLANRERKISRLRDQASALRVAAQECEAELAGGAERMIGYPEAFRLMADELDAKISELESVGANGVGQIPAPVTPRSQ